MIPVGRGRGRWDGAATGRSAYGAGVETLAQGWAQGRWGEVLATQRAPGVAATWLSLLVALVLVALPAAWRRTRVVVTVAHEGAHAVVAVLCGRRLAGVRVHADASGLTLSRGRPRGAGMVATAAAGYPGPALLGLGAALLLGRGYALGVLWLAVLLLAMLLVWVRNAYGLLAVGASLALVGAFSWWAEPRWQSALAYVGTWFLLLGATRATLELAAARRTARRRARARGSRRAAGGVSDPDVLARLTHVPASLWVALFLLLDLGSLMLAARSLLGGAVGA